MPTYRDSRGQYCAVLISVAGEEVRAELRERASIHDYRDFKQPVRIHSSTLVIFSSAVSVAGFQRFDLLESCKEARPRHSVGPETPSA